MAYDTLVGVDYNKKEFHFDLSIKLATNSNWNFKMPKEEANSSSSLE